MDVILLEKINNLGNLGDQVSVKSGYGRNFLIPQGKATEATEANLAKFETRRAELEKNAANSLAEASRRRDQLADLTVTIPANAGNEGKLYGSVNVAEIADAITATGTPVTKHEVILADGPVRQVGEYDVALQLHSDVEAEVRVIVVAED